MSLTTSLIKNKEPLYFHREYQNDFSDKTYQTEFIEQGKRIALVSLPFMSLYKPFIFPLAVGLSSLRTVSSLGQLLEVVYQKKTQDLPLCILKTTISAVSLAGSIFAHPVGMLITTVQDLIIETSSLKNHLQEGNHRKAAESCIKIINDSLYLALFFYGGVEIASASYAMQILISIYQSQSEFKEGRYPESSGHLLLAMVRTNQLMGQLQLLQMKWNSGNSDDTSHRTKALTVQQEREILSRNCQIILSRTRESFTSMGAGATQSSAYQNAIRDNLTGYLLSVNTSEALKLLQEMQANNFVGYL